MKKYFVFFFLTAIVGIPFSFSEEPAAVEETDEVLKEKITKLEGSILDEMEKTSVVLQEKNQLIFQLQAKVKQAVDREKELIKGNDKLCEVNYRLKQDLSDAQRVLVSKQAEFSAALKKIEFLEADINALPALKKQIQDFSERETVLLGALDDANKEIARLNKNVERLSQLAAVQDKAVGSLQSRLPVVQAQLKSDLSKAKGETDYLNQEITRLKQEIEDRVSDLEQAEAEGKKQKEVIVQLQYELKSAERNIKEHAAGSEQTQDTIRKLNEEIARCRQEETAKKEELAQAYVRQEELDQENKQTRRIKKELVASLRDNEALNAQLAKANQEAVQLRQEVDSLNRRLRSTMGEFQEKEEERRLLRKENELVSQLRGKAKDALRNVDDLKRELAGAQNDKEVLSKTINNLNNEIAAAKAKLEALDKNKAIRRLKEEVKEHLQRENDLSAQLKAAEDEIAQLERGGERLTAELKRESDKTIAQLDETLLVRDKEVGVLKKRLEELDKNKAIRRLKEEVREHLQRENEVGAELRAAQDKITALKRESDKTIAQLNNNLTVRDSEIGVLKKKLQSIENNKAIRRLKQDFEESQRREQVLTAKLAQADKNIDELERKVQRLESAKQEYQAAAMGQEDIFKVKENKELSYKLEEAKREVRYLNQEVLSLKKDNAAKDERIARLQKQDLQQSSAVQSRVDMLIRDIQAKDKEIAHLKEIIEDAIDKIQMLSGVYSPPAAPR